MGAWGVALYSDDYAMDVRADYRDALKFGKTDEEALREVIRKDAPPAGTEDEYVFWYALADTMWNYGRLTSEVREKALYYLDTVQEDDRWDSEKTWERRKQILTKLKAKLLSEQPARKRVSPYTIYRCPWKLGDVFAYQFQKPCSEENGMKGKYIVFRKITEEDSWPTGSIVPVIQIYRWMGDKIPTLDELRSMPVVLVSDYSWTPEYDKYLFSLGISSKRELSALNLQYLGNIQDSQLAERSNKQYSGKGAKLFEDVFFLWFTTMKDGKCVFKDYV